MDRLQSVVDEPSRLPAEHDAQSRIGNARGFDKGHHFPVGGTDGPRDQQIRVATNRLQPHQLRCDLDATAWRVKRTAGDPVHPNDEPPTRGIVYPKRRVLVVREQLKTRGTDPVTLERSTG